MPDLVSEFECVDLLTLFAQGFVHAAEMIAHHTQLVLVAPLGRAQFILSKKAEEGKKKVVRVRTHLCLLMVLSSIRLINKVD